MRDETKLSFVILLVIGGVLLLSFNPELTGFSVSEEGSTEEILIIDAQVGSVIAQSLLLQTNDDGLVSVEILPSGEASPWISFDQDSYELLPEVSNSIPFRITVPYGVEEGEYRAKLAVTTVTNEGSAFSDQVIDYIEVDIVVGGEPFSSLVVDEFVIFPLEEGGNVYTQIAFSNEGNVEVEETFVLEIYDAHGALVAIDSAALSFAAYEDQSFIGNLEEILPQGTYSAQLFVDEEVYETTFSVVEEGSLRRSGELLLVEGSADSEGIVEVQTYFQNTGEAVLDVSLIATLSSEGQALKVLQTVGGVVVPGDYIELSKDYLSLATDAGEYSLSVEVLSENVVLAHEEQTFYSSNAVSLEANFGVIFALIFSVLLISHYLLSRRKHE